MSCAVSHETSQCYVVQPRGMNRRRAGSFSLPRATGARSTDFLVSEFFASKFLQTKTPRMDEAAPGPAHTAISTNYDRFSSVCQFNDLETVSVFSLLLTSERISMQINYLHSPYYAFSVQN